MRVLQTMCAALAVALAVVAAAGEVSIENAGLVQSVAIPEYADMSGITWKGGSNFYVVRDGGNTASNNCVLHVMSVSLDDEGRLFSPPGMSKGVVLVGASDAEGVAYDPCSGKVWISDEAGSRIGEYDPESGRPTGRTVPVPAFVTNSVRGNLSLESLTISGDGLTLWAANEEALSCDGESAKPDFKTVVRLMRFMRRDVTADWSPAGMWAYPCDPVEKREPRYSGVSDLCALPDGSLLVLERECSYTTLGRARIYRPDFTSATDVAAFPSLTNSAYVAVSKGPPLYETADGKRYGDGFLKSRVSCYEGLCLGPRNADGSVNLMLVSDGGASCSKKVMLLTVSVQTKPYVRSLKLHGLDVCTLAFDPPDVGGATRTGSCYRYLRGSKVSVGYHLAGVPGLVSPWTLPAHGLSGEGSNATFTVACDDRLSWLSPEALAARKREAVESYAASVLDFAPVMAKVERPWRLGIGGFGRGGIQTGMDGLGSDRTSVYGAEMDLQYGLLRRGPYDLWLGVGGAYCPRQGDAFDGNSQLAAAQGQMELGYGELRLLTVPQRRVTEDLSLGLRMGVAFDWLNAKSSVSSGASAFSESDTRFAAQGLIGVQATYLLTDRLGLYSNVDWRLGGETEFETDAGKSTVDMSGWFWGVGAFFSF